MSREIPPELGKLTNLESLNLKYGNFGLTGCIPRSLRDHLDLDFSELGNLTFC